MSTASAFVFDWVFEHARRSPDAPAVGTPSGWTSYRELAGAVRGLASRLEEGGVLPGAFVTLALPPGPAAVASATAIQALGACAVELNRQLDARTIEEVLAQTGARHAVVHLRDVEVWAQLARAHGFSRLFVVAPAAPSPRLQALLQGIDWTWVDEQTPGGGDSAWDAPVREAEAPALLVYTSGSTGAPRGVVQTHSNVHANTEAIGSYLGLTSADRALSILPLFYCFGRSILQTHLFAGGSFFFDHRFVYPKVVMEAVAEQRCSGFYGVPLTFELIRRHVDLRSIALDSLRYVAQAGGAMSPDTIRWAREVFAPAPLFVMYGQTEATARLSYLPPDRAADKAGSIGRGLDNVELRVVDATGRELAPRAVGELVARGPSITPGYFRAPAETAEILRDGWLWTGDLGWQDEEGFVFLVGRAKDMLKLAGHRVSAAELEHVLSEHPDVREAAVVGVPDAAGQEAAVAFVVAAGDASPDAGELRRFCRQRLPAFKVPREIRFVRELPRTASGKIAKAALREGLDDAILEGRVEAGSRAEGG
ncbi:class I adenylate-forming enzyme family protein [Vulgatibacter incomptus]|uniref:O-succinylbenzoic acid--CoA ligase n=1 Tax=Vulgatibacter incomptus TaxID=1391653 RepID=A0A0K1P8W9_9BACT|nr:class I adenylate-forming enzyme family protein [Vulgatibacter incomptus]AKU89856.1 O-succinylbenzoic acid--CoA ligase [Vulgatibacter incomptus]